MAIIFGLMTQCPGILHPKLSFPTHRYCGSRINGHNTIQLVPRRIPIARSRYIFGKEFGTKYTTYVGRNYHQLSFDNDLPEEPFWLTTTKEAFRALRALFIFLVEQPSQLKYIEWPSFQSTLKTATLTLVLVGLLIITLSSVDSILCFLLAFLSRRTA